MAFNGTLVRGTPAYAPGKFGNGFTGAVYTVGAIGANPVGTLEVWVNTTTTTIVVAVGDSTNSSYPWIGVSAGKATFQQPNGGGYTISGVVINDGAWHHLAMTVDGTNARLWVDGALASTQPCTTGLNLSAKFALGGFDIAANQWVGQIDEVRASNVVRYTTAFTAPTAAFTDDSSTLALWHLDSDVTDSHGAAAPDTTPPTVPTGLTATPGSSQVALSWTASTDAVGVTGYRVYRGGTLVGSPTTTSYTDTGLTNGTAYSYTVAAADAAGNLSAQTAAVTATPAAAGGTIAANDANLVYSPYTWDVSAVRAKTINAGAYLTAEVAGTATSITANFDVSNATAPAPQISYRVDSGPWVSQAVAASIALPIPATNTWAKHLIELRVKSTSETVNRWASPQNSAVVFTGFTVAPNTVTTGTVRKKRFNVLCYGDSITEGVRALGSTQTLDTDRNDGALSWAYPLGGLLGAEVGVVGFGATAFSGGGSGGVPALGSSYNLLWSGTARLFTPVPDLVLVNMGTNDGVDITSAATTFLNSILALGGAVKVAVLRPWNGAHAAQLQAAAAASSAPARVTYIDTTGWFATGDSSDGTHPYGYANTADLAPRLAAAVGPLLTGAGAGTTTTPKRFVNVGGTAKAIG